jgi:hypothetical protein
VRRDRELAQAETLSQDEWPLAQRVEHDDAHTCAFCRDRSGRIIAKTDPDYGRFLGAFHINCRGYWVDIHKDEGHEEAGPDGRVVWVHTKPNWMTPPAGMSQADYDAHFQALLQEHAHFITDPDKYAVFNVPARPTGRDFIVIVNDAGQPAELIFAPRLPPVIRRRHLRNFRRAGLIIRR